MAEEDAPYPAWEWYEDGSVTIHLPKNYVLNLGDDLNRWHRISEDQYHLPVGWKRSSTCRENRRQAVVYGNCLQTIVALLGRHEVHKLMLLAKETETGNNG